MSRKGLCRPCTVIGMPMLKHWATAAAVATAITAIALASATSAGAASPGPGWQVAERVAGNGLTQLAVVNAQTWWAFGGLTSATAYEHNGSTWTRKAFPAGGNSYIAAVAAPSATDAWAFTSDDSAGGGQAVHWNGADWAVEHSFPGPVDGADVISSSDIWVFGGHVSWHYNGSSWVQLSTAAVLDGGSALTPSSIWAYGGTDIDHWNGTSWTSTSVAKLLHAAVPGSLNDPVVAQVVAESADNIYAVVNGQTQDAGGPTVILHYDGRSWTEVASYPVGARPGQASTDGHGGLMFPVAGSYGGPGYLLHYSDSQVRKAVLPVPASEIGIASVANIPGTSGLLAAGLTHVGRSIPYSDLSGVVLEYAS
jgi:hypothetical protein